MSETPNIDQLIPDIYNLLDEDTDHECSEQFLEEAAEALKDLLRRRLGRQERKGGLRFSSLGKPDCQVWYKVNKPEAAEKLRPETQMKFMYGDVLEVLLLYLAKEAGHAVSHEQAEVEHDGVLGHIDAVIDGYVVDAKSASPFAFKKFVDNTISDDDPFGYIAQLSGYCHKLNRPGAFLAINKESGGLALAKLSKEDEEANPPGAAIDRQRAAVAKPQVERGFSPVPEGKSGNMALPMMCSYCVDPSVRILKDDFTWVPAQDIMAGDNLIGFSGPYFSATYEPTQVVQNSLITAPRLRVNTDKGSIIVSADHMFLAQFPSKYKKGWWEARNLQPGMQIKYMGDPWETEETPEAGYLRGFLDGEGCLANHHLSYAQNEGPVLDYVNRLMEERGFDTSQRYTKNGDGCQTVRLNGSNIDSYRAIGILRPIRLLEKARKTFFGLSIKSHGQMISTITSIDVLEEGTVSAITTTNQTLITDGFFSHNCDSRTDCWSDANNGQGLRKFLYSRGIKYLTHVAREPDVYELPLN